IQYIGVVIAGLTSVGSSGGLPNSPIGMLSLNHVSDPRICGCCVTTGQYAEGGLCRGLMCRRTANPSFAALNKGAMAARAVQKREKDRKRAGKQRRVDQK